MKKKSAVDRGELREVWKTWCWTNHSTYFDLLLSVYKIRTKDMTKSELLKIVLSLFFSGYVNAEFVNITRQMECAFDQMVMDGIFYYEKGKPLKLVDFKK